MTRLGPVLVVAGGLAAIVVLEFTNARRIDTTLPRSRIVTAVPPRLLPQVDHTREWVTIALARPLFSPNRRPAADLAGAVGGSPAGLPRLAGIVVGPLGRSAIFAVDGGKPIVVQEGGRVAAYLVKSIEAEEVRLLGPDGARVLSPSFEHGMDKTAGAAAQVRHFGQAPLPR